jgi:zinc D-Ala-D-Ala carboxypeptidase
MTSRRPARTTNRRRSRLGVATVAIVAVGVAGGYRLLTSPSAVAESRIDVPRTMHVGVPSSPPAPSIETVRRPEPVALAEADGAVPDGATVFDDDVAGVANLDRALLGALRRAARDAADEGVEFVVTSGWRSAAYQERLLRDAISKYGSKTEAGRWVATPTTSAHVSGDAVDIGPFGAAWLARHGAAYGLCQIYRNEPWHYERHPDATDHGCPPLYADPTQDPRMQP